MALSRNGVHSCSHFEDIGVVCYKCNMTLCIVPPEKKLDESTHPGDIWRVVYQSSVIVFLVVHGAINIAVVSHFHRNVSESFLQF